MTGMSCILFVAAAEDIPPVAGAQCGYARRERPSQGTRKPETLAGAAGAVLSGTLAERGWSRRHPQRRMVGIGNRDLVAGSRARTPSLSAAQCAGQHGRRYRSLDRRGGGHKYPAPARAPVPRTPGRLLATPPSPARRRQGTPTVRPDSITGLTRSLNRGSPQVTLGRSANFGS